MTPRRAWALIALAALALGLTPWAGIAAALVALGALGALGGMSALAARETLREARVGALERKLVALESDTVRVAEMWRVYQQHG